MPKRGAVKSDDGHYTLLDQLSQILLRPDTTIGTPKQQESQEPIFANGKITPKEIVFSPGLVHTVREIIDNAYDQTTRTLALPVKKIEITVDCVTGRFTVCNNGDSIPVVFFSAGSGIYTPQVVFSELNTSENYDDEKKRRGVGRNGIGAKATALFSKEFTIELVDAVNKKYYKQTFRDNLTIIEEPVIEREAKAKPYTKISWIPDYARFETTLPLSDDLFALIKKKAYDLAACVSGVAVHFNDERIDIKKFDHYIGYNLPDDQPFSVVEAANCVVGVAASDEFRQTSLVNCVPTTNGGTHIALLTRMISKDVAELLSSKKAPVAPALIQKHMHLFVRLFIDNPEFDSQTKKCLTSKIMARDLAFDDAAYGKFIAAVVKKCDFKEIVAREAQLSDAKALSKVSGTKKARIANAKLEDARRAGTKDAAECTLILTEGDSAKALAVAGLTVIGQDKYGVFPLRGKLLNVRGVAATKEAANKELTELVQIIGLQHGADYSKPEACKKLRYGHIMILTDQDVDGSHIKGLINNFIHYHWPALLKRDFVSYLATPIIKVSHGQKKKRTTLSFYNAIDYEEWRRENAKIAESPSTDVKYYKGLGTSTTKEAKEYFSPAVMRAQAKTMMVKGAECDDAMVLAFDKEKESANRRKQWLMDYTHKTPEAKLAELQRIKSAQTISVSDFVNNELVVFSMSDNVRSIPSAIDGFKPSQRIAIYIAQSKVANKEMKVENLASVISAETDYHHGAVSLQECIIGLAQNYVGANNINMLDPNGQFGTRLMGGKDHAAARYIMTQLNRLAPYIFRKEDAPLHQKQENGVPEILIAILPLVLINGAEGIGTGYSVKCAPLNVLDIIDNIKAMMAGSAPVGLVPYFHHFTGTVVDDGADAGNYTTRANYKRLDKQTIEILDLPIGVWSETYTEFLEELLAGDDSLGLQSYDSEFVETPFGDTNKIFRLRFAVARLNEWFDDVAAFEKEFKLIGSKAQQKFSCSNLHMFNASGQLVKYESYNHILADFYAFRIEMYARRKTHLLAQYQMDADVNAAKIRFIEDFAAERITVIGRKRVDIVGNFVKLGYPQFGDGYGYLFEITVDKFTDEEIAKLRAKYEAARSAFAELKSKTVNEMWSAELDEFVAEYRKTIL